MALILIGALAALAAGLYYYDTRVKPEAFRPITQLNYKLLEVDGSLYDSVERRNKHKTVLVYMPDNISSETQTKYMEVVSRAPMAAAKNLNLVVVSRIDIDNLRNLKRLSGFSGPLLRDPSGSILQKTKGGRPADKFAEWLTVELGEDGGIQRVKLANQPEVSWLE